MDHVNIRGQIGFDKPEALIGKASSVFDPYMEPYVSLERQNITEQLLKATKENTVDSRGELPVFTSSTDLFVYIKNTNISVNTRDNTKVIDTSTRLTGNANSCCLFIDNFDQVINVVRTIFLISKTGSFVSILTRDEQKYINICEFFFQVEQKFI